MARDSTRLLAARLSSALLGVSLAASLPMVAPFLALPACVAITLAGALLPLAPLWLFRKVPAGHAHLGPAVRFDAQSGLICFNRKFAEALAENPGCEWMPPLPRIRAWPKELALPLACALILSPALHVYNHPALRTINANAETIEIFVDGRSFGRVEPSSTESPAAGRVSRVPGGARDLCAVSTSGQTIAETRVDVRPGRDHLFAPGAPETCFWLESTAYGRARGAVERIPLEGESRFWAIPEGVLGWFVPSPPPEAGARTTGGTITVLRQGRCDEMPLDR